MLILSDTRGTCMPAALTSRGSYKKHLCARHEIFYCCLFLQKQLALMTSIVSLNHAELRTMGQSARLMLKSCCHWLQNYLKSQFVTRLRKPDSLDRLGGCIMASWWRPGRNIHMFERFRHHIWKHAHTHTDKWNFWRNTVSYCLKRCNSIHVMDPHLVFLLYFIFDNVKAESLLLYMYYVQIL